MKPENGSDNNNKTDDTILIKCARAFDNYYDHYSNAAKKTLSKVFEKTLDVAINPIGASVITLALIFGTNIATMRNSRWTLPPDQATSILKQNGITPKEVGGYPFLGWGCGKDLLVTRFKGTNDANGTEVSGVVCKGWLTDVGTVKIEPATTPAASPK